MVSSREKPCSRQSYRAAPFWDLNPRVNRSGGHLGRSGPAATSVRFPPDADIRAVTMESLCQLPSGSPLRSPRAVYSTVTGLELLGAGSNESRVRLTPLLPHPFFWPTTPEGAQRVSAFQLPWSVEDRLEQRAVPRLPVAVPAVIRVGNQEHSANLLNLSPSGAMIETPARLIPQAAVTLRCGTIGISAAVVWDKGRRVGLSFRESLSDSQIAEQLSRSRAIATRRDRRGPL